MPQIVLVRHGESLWNRENRFTGWTDVDLSPKGTEEAHAAGRLLREEGFVLPEMELDAERVLDLVIPFLAPLRVPT